MIQRRSRRSMRSLLFTFILLLGLLPIGAVTASGHQSATLTEVSFISTPVEILEPGEEWIDEAGNYHFRGEVARDEVTGDITGEAIITFNGDFFPSPNCDPEDIENCFEGRFSGWGTVVITDEHGRWEGDFLIEFSFEEGEEPFMFGKVVLTGRDGNAGTSIIADITFAEDEEDETAHFDGVMVTMGIPAFGVQVTTELCFNEETFETTGAFTASGAIDSSGSATGEFLAGGDEWTSRYGLFADVTVTDEWGSFTMQWVGEVQDHPESSVGWGNFVITNGTGAYEGLYGHGKVSGAAMENLRCESGFGARLQFLGNVNMHLDR